MKTLILLGVWTAAAVLGGCASGNISSRDDYADPTFSSRSSKRAARESEIRKLYPTLSEKQIQQKLDAEFPPNATR